MSIILDHLLGRYVDKLLSLVEECIGNFINFRSEFESMKENLERIQHLLETVDKHGMKALTHHTNVLRELMYDVEDIIADYSDLSIRSRSTIGTKLQNINEKLEETNSKLENSVNAIVASGLKWEDVGKPRQCLPINDVTEIVGLGDVVSKIKKWVMNEDNEGEVHYNCIGLVGKGGSGKTTLAQIVFEDEKIKEYFKLKMMFVTVSQPVDVKVMMKRMLKKLDPNTRDDDDEYEMSKKIHKYLNGSRYFLILDDVWSLRDGGWWEKIKSALPKGSENCILVTSRTRNIARQMGVVENQIHEPEALREEDAWILFCKNISTRDVSDDTRLKDIGKEIVRKCGGLPLAIKVMAGVSSYDISTVQWKRIRDSFMHYLSNNENDSTVMGSLELSYDDLPEKMLQQCLLCFGVFPEDYVISRDTMITWWIGEGFVPLTEDGRLSVESAESCFDELVNRSLLEVVTRDYTGKVWSCKVHDIVREMLIRKGKSEAFFEIGKDKISRRIVLNDDDISNANNQISVSKIKVRAVVRLSNRSLVTKEFMDKICDVCKYLRVLNLKHGFMNDFPILPHMVSRLTKLKHLTLLYISDVPTNISELKFLLVLRLDGNFKELPSSITELNKLIWLDVRFCIRLQYCPKGLGNISTLQVLQGFKPSPKGCRFDELRKLTQLVKLEMRIESAYQFSDGELDALSKLDCLRHLDSYYYGEKMDNNLIVQKLDKLVLPKKLDEVSLTAYPGDVTPSWLCTEDLPYLRYLTLFGGGVKHFNKKFYEGEMWGITHLSLNCGFESGDWNVIRGRLPDLKTIEFTSIHKYWDNFPREEIDEKGIWRSTGQRA